MASFGGLRTRARISLQPQLQASKTLINTAPNPNDITNSANPSIFDNPLNATKLARQRLAIYEKQLQAIKPLTVSFNLYTENDFNTLPFIRIDKVEDSGMGTVNDPRMSVNPGEVCRTCNNVYSACSGHEGVIDLPVPIINPAFINQVIHVLRSVCWDCGRLRITEPLAVGSDLDKYSGIARLHKMAEASSGKYCSHKPESPTDKPCQRILYDIYPQSSKKGVISYSIKQEGSKKKEVIKHKLGAPEIYKIFSAISAEDAELLGFDDGSHPKDLIMRHLVVIPPCLRPDKITANGPKSINQFTSEYKKIVKYIRDYYNSTSDKNKSDIINFIQTGIEKIIMGVDGQLGLFASLGSKQGLLRQHVSGRRVVNVARTVLSNNPSLRFGQLSVPAKWASSLLYPVYVTADNIDSMNAFLRAGKIERIVPNNGRFNGMTILPKATTVLHIGYLVYRWMIDGDLIILNRQPTLHKQGIMGFHVVLWEHETIGLHPAYCKYFNADFDGDEANLYAPQSLEALSDVANLMHIHKCVLSSTNNMAYGLILDAVGGFYILSDPKTTVNQNTYLEILSKIEGSQLATLDQRLAMYNIRPFSGQALISALFPENFYYNYDGVLIVNGILIRGRMTKAHVGDGANNVIKYLHDLDPQYAFDFITYASDLTNRYLQDRPVTMGIEDCMVFDRKSKAEKKEIEKKIKVLEGVLEGNLERVLSAPIRAQEDSSKEISPSEAISTAITFEQITKEDIDKILAEAFQNISQQEGLISRDITDISLSPAQRAEIEVQVANLKTSLLTVRDKLNAEIKIMEDKARNLEAMKLKARTETERRRIEEEIKSVVAIGKLIGTKMVNDELKHGNLALSVSSGAKGNLVNAASTSGVVGSQIVEGERVKALMIFARDDPASPYARGFVSSGFAGMLNEYGKYIGPTIRDLYAIAAASREGLGSTSLKTAYVGEIARNIGSVMENILSRQGFLVLNKVILTYNFTYDSAKLIPTSFGYPSFINLKHEVGRFNANYGYVKLEEGERYRYVAPINKKKVVNRYEILVGKKKV